MAWASELDLIAKSALRFMVRTDSVVAAVGSWGFQDGFYDSRPVAFVASSKRSHATLICNELAQRVPSVGFVFDCPSVSHAAALHGARVIWGERALPPAPSGEAFLRDWLPHLTARLALERQKSLAHAALAHWDAMRMIMLAGGIEVPQLLDLPQRVLDLYVARNAKKTPPDAVPIMLRTHVAVELLQETWDAQTVGRLLYDWLRE